MIKHPDPELISAEILDAAGHQAPPTDLCAVCALWPDLKISEDSLDNSGYLVSLGIYGTELIVRRKDPPPRKRFTIAHELGHWVLSNLQDGGLSLRVRAGPDVPPRPHHKGHTVEEAWCNAFASSLLMPKKDVCRYLDTEPATDLVTKVLNGPSTFLVSEEAFLTGLTRATPVSVVEIVATGDNCRMKRRFLSALLPSDRLEKVTDRVLHEFCVRRVGRSHPFAVDGYEAHVRPLHISRGISSWLACVVPIEG